MQSDHGCERSHEAPGTGLHPQARQLLPGARLRGVDPLTGKDTYLMESTRNEREAEKIRTRLLAQVEQQQRDHQGDIRVRARCLAARA
jgi:hypothetical protein